MVKTTINHYYKLKSGCIVKLLKIEKENNNWFYQKVVYDFVFPTKIKVIEYYTVNGKDSFNDACEKELTDAEVMAEVI